MRRRLHLAVAASLLAATAGCTVPAGSTGAPAGSVPAPTYTVNVLGVATPKPRTPAPALKITGAAWPAILASLARYGQWLLANPDPSLVGTVAVPGCSMYDLLSTQVEGLLWDQAYLRPSAPVLGLVVGPSPAPGTPLAVLGTSVTIDVTAYRAVEPVLSRSKATQISAFPALPPTALRVTLQRGGAGKWRFCTVNAATDSGADEDPSVPLL
jgi:hypothetical protein